MANIYFKYPNATSPTHTLQFTRYLVFPVPCDDKVPTARVETMGGVAYVSQKGPTRKIFRLKFQNLPDGDNFTDYIGLQYFFKTITLGGRKAFDYVDKDSNITTVRFANDPTAGSWQRDRELRSSANIELIEEI